MINVKMKEIIQETVDQTVIKLKRANLIRDDEKSAFKKTENLLKKYKQLKMSDAQKGSITDVTLKKVDFALKTLEGDDYEGLIEMIYFEEKTREECAEFFGVEPLTITRNKKRLVNSLKNILFADDVIKELFL